MEAANDGGAPILRGACKTQIERDYLRSAVMMEAAMDEWRRQSGKEPRAVSLDQLKFPYGGILSDDGDLLVAIEHNGEARLFAWDRNERQWAPAWQGWTWGAFFSGSLHKPSASDLRFNGLTELPEVPA